MAYTDDQLVELRKKLSGRDNLYKTIHTLSTKKKEIEEKNVENKDLLTAIKEALNEAVSEVKISSRLKSHPVCLSAGEGMSFEMEKVLNALPNDNKVNAKKVLEINENHPIKEKLENLYKNNKDELEKITKILYSQARLIEGLPIENPTEISNLICEYLSK